jgi:hypothetical protein
LLNGGITGRNRKKIFMVANEKNSSCRRGQKMNTAHIMKKALSSKGPVMYLMSMQLMSVYLVSVDLTGHASHGACILQALISQKGTVQSMEIRSDFQPTYNYSDRRQI